ncbi:MAG: hypothetical protein FWH53_03895 [Leptospirales bacterium]|nr:hypothetical protein [Leptospirales bacterium]
MKNYKKSILLIIFVISFTSCNKTKIYETEPNNTFETANKIEIGKEIIGYLESENDIDNFLLDINETQILKINLSGVKGVNHAIYIYRKENVNFKLIKIIDDNRKSAPETFANLYVSPGQYIFSITHGERDEKKGNTENPYILKITSRPYSGEEREPNDTPHAANEIYFDQPIIGYFSPGRNPLNKDQKNPMIETDWYKFDISVSMITPLLIDVSLYGVLGIDSVISVFNSSLEEIVTVDNAGTGEGEYITDLGLKESGTYYIRVFAKNFSFNNETPYELRITSKPYDSDYELEPNNTFEQANIIMNNSIRGKISSVSDMDCFKFSSPTKNRYYKIDCELSADFSPTLTAYDNNRNKLFEINNFGSDQDFIPPFFVKDSIYISLSASKMPPNESNYKLSIEEYYPDGQMEMEPNNSKAAANLITGRMSGFINSKNDADYYLYKCEDRKKVQIRVRGVRNGKITFSTTDQMGFIIKTKDVNSDEEVSHIEVFDKKGFIIIESVTPNYEYPYTIIIEEIL